MLLTWVSVIKCIYKPEIQLTFSFPSEFNYSKCLFFFSAGLKWQIKSWPLTENAIGLNTFPLIHSICTHGVFTKVKQKTRFRVQMLAQAQTLYSWDSTFTNAIYPNEFLAHQFSLEQSTWKRQAKHWIWTVLSLHKMTGRNLKISEKKCSNRHLSTFFLFWRNVSDFNKIQKNQTTSERKTNCIHQHILARLRKIKNEEKS